MCGIVGQLGRWNGDPSAWLDEAVESLRHRGPDDSGLWRDDAAEVYLGHRRLAVVDTTVGGHQPFVSDDGRYVLVFNGEVYNHVALRRELGPDGSFRTTSDTEVLIRAIQRWGLLEALRRINGMFALAVWDRQERRMGLARDRIGEKPLFLQRRGASWRFASEMKALRAAGSPAPAVDRGAMALYFRLGYVPSPYCIHEGVTKIAPGSVHWLGDDGDHIERYWTVPELGHGATGPDEADELRLLLHDAVGLRMQADVPVGAFLSGGIDSSLVTALMSATGAKVRTFTIGFEQAGFDESGHARRVADHLGTDHTELRVSPADARDVVPRLPDMFDEPFADSSAIPTALVAQLAGHDVTVALSGDGGDELFGGYTRYRRLRLGSPLVAVPAPLATGVAHVADRAGQRVPGVAGAARTLERVGLGVESGGARGLYRSLVSLWEDPSAIVGAIPEPGTALTDGQRWSIGRDLVRHAMGADLLTYLPDDILVKVDRTSMAVGLEARVPLLDHRIVEWSRAHARPRVRRESDMKAPLRSVLAEYVPEHLFERPKMGFGAPVGEWLRGPLRPWAEDLLSEEQLGRGGLLDPAPVRSRWATHLSGAVDHSFPLWTVLCFQAWRQRWGVES